MVDHVPQGRICIAHGGRKPPPKIRYFLGSFTALYSMEGHQAVFDGRPKMWCNCGANHVYMILLRKLAFKIASAAAVWKLI